MRARLELEPPRFCTQCHRRMVVQVIPRTWTATCVEHGTTTHDESDLLAFDREHLWHPYSSMTAPVAGPPGRVRQRRTAPAAARRPPVEVVDAMSSWWCAIHGYAVPELDAAAATS